MSNGTNLRWPAAALPALVGCLAAAAAPEALAASESAVPTALSEAPLPAAPPELGAPAAEGSVVVPGHGASLVLIGRGVNSPYVASAAPAPTVRRLAYLLPGERAKLSVWQRLATYFGLTTRSDEMPPTWRTAMAGVPPAAAVASVDGNLYCIGGVIDDAPTAEVRRLTLSRDGVRSASAPPLPAGRAMAGAAALGGRLFVIGGMGRDGPLGDGVFLSAAPGEPNAPPKGWSAWPDPASADHRPIALPYGVLAPLVVKRHDDTAAADALYVLGGWRRDADTGRWVAGTAVYKWLPSPPQRAGWFQVASSPEGLAIVSAVPMGPAHILALAARGEPAVGPDGLPSPLAGRVALLYHTFTDRWVQPAWPAERLAAASLQPMGEDSFFLVRRGADGRAASIARGGIAYTKAHFRWGDYAMVGVYLAALMVIGGYYARRERSTEDYFLGARKVPWWAAGLSIYATGISAISFMAIPAKTYATNWLYISQGVFPVITTFLVAYTLLPLLRRLNITTIMEYQQMRFGRSIRVLSSALTVLGQIAGRMSVVVLLPAIALSAVTGIDTVWAILIMGVLATAYTVAGGIHAVIWTDVLQIAVVFGGAILSLVLIVAGSDGGLDGVLRAGGAAGKFQSFDWSWDFTGATVWVFCIWSVYDMILSRLGQEAAQRAFATDGVPAARRSMVTCALVSVPGTLLFYAVGTALFAYYRGHPGELDPTLSTDGIFPLFIAQKLPAGVAGLVVAALFAASMSTLDSGMNTVATVVVTDWYGLLGRRADERRKLRVARAITLLTGLLATGVALYMAALNIRSLWDMFIKATQLILGGLGGVMLLGMLTRRANTFGMWAGIVTGTAAMWLLSRTSRISFFTYGTIAMGVCVAVGYLVSIATGGTRKDLTGLTLWTARREAGAAAAAQAAPEA